MNLYPRVMSHIFIQKDLGQFKEVVFFRNTLTEHIIIHHTFSFHLLCHSSSGVISVLNVCSECGDVMLCDL